MAYLFCYGKVNFWIGFKVIFIFRKEYNGRPIAYKISYSTGFVHKLINTKKQRQAF